MRTKPMPISTRIRRLLALILASAWLSAAPAALASHGHDNGGESEFSRGEASIGPNEAAALVRARTGGRVLGIRAVRRGDRLYYRVKVLTSGYVRIYRVDARTGAVDD
ncbi:MAG: hypothetical protein R3174_03370 [Gammaproteobacteria bacterium]|nr:hypothetical protein [Gammaproteobacteria bacterium]